MTPEAMKTLWKSASIMSVIAGGLGMAMCAPFIWGSTMGIVVAASLPFIAGAVLIGSGLVSYSLLIKA